MADYTKPERIHFLIGAVTEALSVSNEPQRMLDLVLSTLCEVMALECAWVQRLDVESQSLWLAASRGFTTEMRQEVEQGVPGRRFVGQVAGLGNRIVVADLLRENEFGLLAFARTGLRSLVVVPLRTYRVQGVMGAASREKKRFNAGTAALLEVISGVIGMALDKAELFQRAIAVEKAAYPVPQPQPSSATPPRAERRDLVTELKKVADEMATATSQAARAAEQIAGLTAPGPVRSTSLLPTTPPAKVTVSAAAGRVETPAARPALPPAAPGRSEPPLHRTSEPKVPGKSETPVQRPVEAPLAAGRGEAPVRRPSLPPAPLPRHESPPARAEPAGPRKVRVFIVESQVLFRHGLRPHLAQANEIEVVGESDDFVDDTAAMIGELETDVALVDANPPSLSGLDLARQIRQRSPATMVVLLSSYPDEGHAFEALRVGVAAYVSKDMPGSAVVAAILRAAAGQGDVVNWLARPLVARQALAYFQAQHKRNGLTETLTPDEASTLSHLAAGTPPGQVGRVTGATEDEMRARLAAIAGKLAPAAP